MAPPDDPHEPKKSPPSPSGDAQTDGGEWPPPEDERTQLRGTPSWTSDTTGFGETTQSMARPQSDEFSGEPTLSSMPRAVQGPRATEPDGGWEADATRQMSLSPPAEDAAVPAHLQLPNFDFGLPAVPGGSETGAPNSSDAPPVDLPTHLQLPNFPDLGLPTLTESPPAADEPPPEGGAGVASEGGAPPPLRPAIKAPPPLRPPSGSAPPPRRSTEPSDAPTDFFGLAETAAPAAKRNLTLVGEGGMTLPEDSPQRRALWPAVLVALLLTVVVGAVVLRGPLLALLAPARKTAPVVPAPLAPHDEARLAFAAGVKAFAAKDYLQAAGAFEKSVTLDPNLADPHRSLGIVYATMQEQAKAVSHYKRYLELSPAATDAVEVRKIVDDYARAQAAKEAPPAASEPAEPQDKPSKKRGSKRRRR